MIDGEIATGCLIAKNNAPGVFVHAKPYGAIDVVVRINEAWRYFEVG